MRVRLGWLTTLLSSLALTCLPRVDPEVGRYACASHRDCGMGWECRPQVSDGGRCYAQGACLDIEACNGLDDDCNGAVDDGFDFSSDAAHCGGCGRACTEGTRCLEAACREARCDDGVDNDGDGGTDCGDVACLGLPCAADGGRCALGFADGGLVDGGPHGASADAGVDEDVVLGCFGR